MRPNSTTPLPFVIFLMPGMNQGNQLLSYPPQMSPQLIFSSFPNQPNAMTFQNSIGQTQPNQSSLSKKELNVVEGKKGEDKAKISPERGTCRNDQKIIPPKNQDKEIKKRPSTYRTERTEYLSKKIRNRGKNDQRVLRNRHTKYCKKSQKCHQKKQRQFTRVQSLQKKGRRKSNLKKIRKIRKAKQVKIENIDIEHVEIPQIEIGKLSFMAKIKKAKTQLLKRKFQSNTPNQH